MTCTAHAEGILIRSRETRVDAVLTARGLLTVDWEGNLDLQLMLRMTAALGAAVQDQGRAVDWSSLTLTRDDFGYHVRDELAVLSVNYAPAIRRALERYVHEEGK